MSNEINLFCKSNIISAKRLFKLMPRSILIMLKNVKHGTFVFYSSLSPINDTQYQRSTDFLYISWRLIKVTQKLLLGVLAYAHTLKRYLKFESYINTISNLIKCTILMICKVTSDFRFNFN